MSRVEKTTQVDFHSFKVIATKEIIRVAVPTGSKVNVLAVERSLGHAVELLSDTVAPADHRLVDQSVIMEDHVAEDCIGAFRMAQANEPCASCDAGTLVERRGIEVGHVFYLGNKYAAPLKATFIDGNQKENPIEMGCFGLGVSRLMAAVAETSCDSKGLIWPEALAPYGAVVVSAGSKHGTDPIATTAKDLAVLLEEEIPILRNNLMLDDRWKESPGTKLTEAELVGYPYIIVVGRTFSQTGKIEIQCRATGDRTAVALDDVRHVFTDMD